MPQDKKDELDKPTQLEAVWAIMRDGQWHTLAEISELANCPPASASARLRDLRKAEFGACDVERQYLHRGLYRYRVTAIPHAAGPTSGSVGEAR